MSHRTLAYVFGVATALSAQMAAALGLGEIKLNSTLNQPLDAEIQLLQVRDLSEQEILVGLASIEDFRRIGVERPFFLADLKFSINLDSPNGPVIEVTSEKPVREPFLNFLVQAQWPSGRLMREYTLLLDLPVYDDQQQAQPVQAAPQQRTGSGQTAAARSPRDTQNRQQQTQQPEAQTDSADSGSTYGPVKASDTLWDIAAAARGDSGVSVQQAMIAIHRANPGAFINNNINLLRQGQVLRIPNRDEMASLTARDAIAEVATHNQRWSSGAETSAEGPQLEGSQSYSRTERQSEGPEGRVKLSSPQEYTNSAEGRGTGGADGSTEALETELSSTLEELDKTRSENQELRSRLEALEAQIETMERLVDISNEEMRALQLASQNARQQDGAAPEDQAEGAGDTPEMAAAGDGGADSGAGEQLGDSGPADAAVTGGAETSADVATEAEADESVEMAAEGADSVDEEPSQSVAGTDTGLAATDADSEVESAEAPAAEPTEEQAEASGPQQAIDPTKVVRTAPRPEKGLLDLLMDNILFVALGLIALLAAILVFLRARQSANAEDEFDDLMPAADDEWQEAEADTDYTEAEDSAAFIGAASDSDDFEDQEPEHAEQETEDPVAEAEIYIALAKYEQAEEILQQALENDPQNSDIRLKMLELYAAQQDIDKFDAQFAEVQAIGDADVIERGEDLRRKIEGAPEFDHSRFATGAVAAATATAVVGQQDDDQDDDLSLDLSYDDLEFDASSELSEDAGELDREINASLDDVSADEFDGLEFDLDDELEKVATDTEQPGTLDSSLAGDEDDLSFDFELDIEGEDSAELSEESNVETLDLDDEFAFDLGSADTEEPDQPSAQDKEDEFGDLEFDLAGLDQETEEQDSGSEAFTANDELKAEIANSSSVSEQGELDEFDFGDFQLEDEPAQVASAAEEDPVEQADASADAEDDLDMAEDLDLSALDQELDAMTSELDMDFADEFGSDDQAGDAPKAGTDAPDFAMFEEPLEENEEPSAAYEEPSAVNEEPSADSEELSASEIMSASEEVSAHDDFALELEAEADEDLPAASTSAADLAGLDDELADLDKFESESDEDEELATAELDGQTSPAEWVDLDEPVELEQNASIDDVQSVQADAQAPVEEVALASAESEAEDELPDYEALMNASEEFDLGDLDDGDDDGDLGFLSDSDETATKLDLARAYIDMGDAHGARDILEEILQEGSDEQRQEAQELMDRV